MSQDLQEDPGIDLLFLFNTIRRRFITVALGTLFVMLLAGIYTVLVPERFTSSTKVLFDPTGSGVQTTSVTSNIPRARIESEIEIAKSETTLLRAIRNLNLVSRGEFRPRINPLMDLYGLVFDVPIQTTDATSVLNAVRANVKDAVSVRQVGLSSVIQFDAETKDSELSAELANAIASAYIQVQIESKIQSAINTLEIIQQATEAARENLETSQVSLVGYLDQNASFIASQTGNAQIGLLAQDLQLGQSRLASLADQQARLDRLIAQSDFDALGAELLGSLSGDIISEMQAQAFQELEARRLSLVRARQEGRAPDDVQAQLSRLEEELSGLASERVQQIVQQANEQQRQLSRLSSQLETEVFSVDLPPAIAAELFTLQSSAQSARRQYSGLLEQSELLALQTRTQIADSRVFSQALAGSKSFPNRQLILALAAVLGLGLSISFVIFFEVYFGGFSSGGQLRDYFGVSDVVEIPKFGPKESIIDMSINEPFSTPVEKMRLLRALLELKFAESKDAEHSGGHVAAMMSSMPGEGKSTAAIGLAMVCSSVGLRVALVDLDFRRPQISARTSLYADKSLMNYLRTGENFPVPQAFYAEGMQGNIDVFTTDFDDSAMADQLFFGSHFENFVGQLRNSYDYVILDTAPVLSVAASRFVLQVTDNMVFCVKANDTNKRIVSDTYDSLGLGQQGRHIPILALSQTKSKEIGYYNAYQAYKAN